MNVNATLFFECLFFLSFVWLTMRYIWPHMDAVLVQRQLDVERGIERARAAEDELQRAGKEAQAIMKAAHAQAALVLQQAQNDADLLVKSAETAAEQAKEAAMSAGVRDIAQAQDAARNSLKTEIATFALMMACKALRQHKDVTDSALSGIFAHDADDAAS